MHTNTQRSFHSHNPDYFYFKNIPILVVRINIDLRLSEQGTNIFLILEDLLFPNRWELLDISLLLLKKRLPDKLINLFFSHDFFIFVNNTKFNRRSIKFLMILTFWNSQENASKGLPNWFHITWTFKKLNWLHIFFLIHISYHVFFKFLHQHLSNIFFL